MSENDSDTANADTGSGEPSIVDRWPEGTVVPIEVFVPLDQFDDRPDWLDTPGRITHLDLDLFGEHVERGRSPEEWLLEELNDGLLDILPPRILAGTTPVCPVAAIGVLDPRFEDYLDEPAEWIEWARTRLFPNLALTVEFDR